MNSILGLKRTRGFVRIRNKKTREDYQLHFRVNSTPDANGCWIYDGCKTKFGYGSICAFGVARNAHRVAAWAFGILDDLDSPLDVLHKNFVCKSPACVNPDHLYTGTARDNMRDSIEAGTFKGDLNLPEINQYVGRTHCPEGHPYDGENLYTKPDGRRVCRTCRREQYFERKKEKEVWNEAYAKFLERNRERESEKAESPRTQTWTTPEFSFVG